MRTLSFRSRIDPLPIPGVVLGTYPERRREPLRSGDTLLERARGLLPQFRRREDWAAFAAETQARREVLEPLSQDAFDCIVTVIRKLLFSEGFERGLLNEAMACVCEATRRSLNMAPFDTQVVAARLMLDNLLAEMETGEGKTLASAMAAAIAAMAGIPVHCITANDYLVERDANKMRPLFDMLKIRVGTVCQRDEPPARRLAYGCDITYCTAKELVFDYLKDGVQLGRARNDLMDRVRSLSQDESGAQQPFLRGLCMAIIDEADSVLLDEAGTPLILARNRPLSSEVMELQQALRVARNLHAPRHFIAEGDRIELTKEARTLLDKLCQGNALPWRDSRRCEEVIAQALAALHLYHRDRQYVIHEGKICIIDQTTGRVAQGRSWSRGLHQLMELKEACELTGTQDTIAKITYQRFFPRYLRLSGTSGTLHEARGELRTDYKLGVVKVSLRCASQRMYQGMRVYASNDDKWQVVCDRVRELSGAGRPVLIGTDSVADSEHLSHQLSAQGLVHQVLNARQDQQEAAIVAQAGARGAITVATNMAGRGTDIALDDGIAALGGLHVICCQVNAEARIDRQLYGRCARQGDPGSVETILSLEEPLIRKRIPGWALRVLRALSRKRKPLAGQIVCLVIRLAQQLEESARRMQRRDLMRRDASNERRLSLSGMSE